MSLEDADSLAQANLSKLKAEIAKIEAETSKIRNETSNRVFLILKLLFGSFVLVLYIKEIILPAFERENIQLSLANEITKRELSKKSDSLSFERANLEVANANLEGMILRYQTAKDSLLGFYDQAAKLNLPFSVANSLKQQMAHLKQDIQLYSLKPQFFPERKELWLPRGYILKVDLSTLNSSATGNHLMHVLPFTLEGQVKPTGPFERFRELSKSNFDVWNRGGGYNDCFQYSSQCQDLDKSFAMQTSNDDKYSRFYFKKLKIHSRAGGVHDQDYSLTASDSNSAYTQLDNWLKITLTWYQ